jgi:membrane-bound lytic murein transglycosylase B
MDPRACACALILALAAVPARALPLADHPELQTFIQDMHRTHGFSERALEQLFRSARLRPEILQAIERPREALPWHDYRRQFVNPTRIEQGAAFWRRHAPLLARAETEYGVPPEIVVAILGVETQYGRQTGRWSVLDALTTLTLRHPPRAAFFRQELEQYLLLAREQRFNPLAAKGSYAGALGMPQFIPSSWRRYAVDFDGNGRRDLLGNTADVIGSVANFLRVHGWQPEGPVADAARVEGALHPWLVQLGIRPVLPLHQFVRHGVSPVTHRDPDLPAALIVLEGEAGPEARLGYNNFYVITRYNRSQRYAMAVHDLAEQIRQRYRESR